MWLDDWSRIAQGWRSLGEMRQLDRHRGAVMCCTGITCSVSRIDDHGQDQSLVNGEVSWWLVPCSALMTPFQTKLESSTQELGDSNSIYSMCDDVLPRRRRVRIDSPRFLETGESDSSAMNPCWVASALASGPPSQSRTRLSFATASPEHGLRQQLSIRRTRSGNVLFEVLAPTLD
jgi:hypothetical protein